MTKSNRAAAKRLLDLALTTEAHHIHVSYSPHVQLIEARVFAHGWHSDKRCSFMGYAYLDGLCGSYHTVVDLLDAVERHLEQIPPQ